MRQQRGATLIIVLILLVVITIIGTIAVRQGLVGLNIATNSQAQQLLIQNSDAAFFNVEKEDNLIQALSTSGMFGYISGAANQDKELVFCFRGTEHDFFNIGRASIMQWEEGKQKPTNNALGTDGYCDAKATDSNFFTSGRKAVMTQVAVKFSSQQNNDPFFGQILGTDEKTVKLERSKPLKIFAVSIMPTLTSADSDKINTCLNSHMSEVTIPAGVVIDNNETSKKAFEKASKSVTQCLAELNVPFSTYVTEYVLAQDFV